MHAIGIMGLNQVWDYLLELIIFFFRQIGNPEIAMVTPSLNRGFKMAKSVWVLWLNADDILVPGAIWKYAVASAKHPKANVIHGHLQFFMDGYNTISKKQYFNNFSRLKTVFGVVAPPTTGTLFSTKVLLENPLDLDFHYMMDAEWVM